MFLGTMLNKFVYLLVSVYIWKIHLYAKIFIHFTNTASFALGYKDP